METKSLRPLSEPEESALKKWRKGGYIDKQDAFILILSLLVLLLAIMLWIKAITADPLHTMEKHRAATRQGPE